MLEPHLAKRTGEKFKHKITAQFRGISPIWMLSLCARDIGGMWMSPTLYSEACFARRNIPGIMWLGHVGGHVTLPKYVDEISKVPEMKKSCD